MVSAGRLLRSCSSVGGLTGQTLGAGCDVGFSCVNTRVYRAQRRSRQSRTHERGNALCLPGDERLARAGASTAVPEGCLRLVMRRGLALAVLPFVQYAFAPFVRMVFACTQFPAPGMRFSRNPNTEMPEYSQTYLSTIWDYGMIPL
jgi:hypothetical protein